MPERLRGYVLSVLEHLLVRPSLKFGCMKMPREITSINLFAYGKEGCGPDHKVSGFGSVGEASFLMPSGILGLPFIPNCPKSFFQGGSVPGWSLHVLGPHIIISRRRK